VGPPSSRTRPFLTPSTPPDTPTTPLDRLLCLVVSPHFPPTRPPKMRTVTNANAVPSISCRGLVGYHLLCHWFYHRSKGEAQQCHQTHASNNVVTTRRPLSTASTHMHNVADGDIVCLLGPQDDDDDDADVGERGGTCSDPQL
jgi:hypothetical protein